MRRARERDDDYYARFDCRIPFLNGGLFEPLFGYDWVNTEILLPDDLFSNKETTKEGAGILDVFDRFNFTVNEAEPLEKEVAIDLEMLGKVFENLLAENLRQASGTYYTPRVIVSYMCQQSLINYLSINLPTIPRADVETFVRIGYAQAEFEAARTAKHNQKFLPESISRSAKQIDKLLEQITFCDPAIGSGAFPVGMMQEIVRARTALAAVEGMPERNAYELKRHAIQNSLYGVDIDPGAVEIAKLRLWLSLVVDEDDRDKIQALPNLDYKVMQGNSLLDEFHGVKLLDDDFIEKSSDTGARTLQALKAQIAVMREDAIKVRQAHGARSPQAAKHEQEIDKLLKHVGVLVAQPEELSEDLFVLESKQKLDLLKRRHKEFFDETSPEKKKRLRAGIETLEWEFMEATLKERDETEALRELARHRRDNRKSYFLWKLHFVEVFQLRGGFDVVIANPPYLNSRSMARENPELRQAIQASYSMTRGSWDIYIAFFEKGFALLNEEGVLAFISPDKWISKPFGDELRVRTNERIFSILKAGRDVFESVNVDAIVSVFVNEPQPFLRIYDYMGTTLSLKRTVEKSTLTSPYAYDWLFSNFIELLVKLSKQPKRLSEFAECENSCATDDAYRLREFVEEETRNHRPGEFLQMINTGTIGKYSSKWGLRQMVYLGERYNRPVVNRKRFLKAFPKSYGTKSIRKKLILKGLNLLDACLDSDGSVIPGIPTLLIPSDDLEILKFLLAIVNSSVAFFYLKEKYPASSYNQGTTFTKEMLNDLPMPRIASKSRAELISIVDRILAAKRNNPQAVTRKLEEEIDHLVYKLYGLTDEEIAIVEGRA